MQSDYLLHQTKAIKKSFDNGSKLMLQKYMDGLNIFDIADTKEWTEIFNSTESMGNAKYLAESETPPISSLNEGRQTSITQARFGDAIEVTSTDRQRFKDNTTSVDIYLTRQRNRLLRSLNHFFITEIHKFINEGFNSGSNYLAPDGVEIFGTHTWATTGSSSWTNATNSKLNVSALDALDEYGGAFVDGNGQENPLSFDTIVVKKGSDNAREAKRILAEGITPTAINDINIYEGAMRIIETPYITSANKNFWVAFALNNVESSPFRVAVTKRPQLSEPWIDKNEAVRTNAEGFFTFGVVDMPFATYAGNGTL